MTTPERIWAATPSDGVMKDETLYGWTTDEHLQAWIDEEDTDLNDPVVYVEYVRRDPAVLAELPEVKRLVEEAVWAVAQVADKELERWGFATGPDGFGRRAEMRNAIAEELPSVKAMRSTAAAIREARNG